LMLIFLRLSSLLLLLSGSGCASAEENEMNQRFQSPKAVSMAEFGTMAHAEVSGTEVSDYVFGGYMGEWPSPPHADLNPSRAFIVSWTKFPFRFVFAHEGSYCPWFEFPSGSGVCFQFFEGNDGL